MILINKNYPDPNNITLILNKLEITILSKSLETLETKLINNN